MSIHKIRSEKRIKQDAKAIKKAKGISHSEALDIAVQEAGYPNYYAYKRALDESELDTKPDVIQLRNELVNRAIDYAIFIPTETGLKKAILDATAPMRDLFELESFHIYREQLQGTDHRKRTSAYFVNGSVKQETVVSLYRPNTKKGDPRMWFKGLKDFASPNDKVAVIFNEGKPHLLNLSKVYDLDIYRQFLDQVFPKLDSIVVELLTKLKSLAKSNKPLKSSIVGDTAIGRAVEDALGIPANSSKAPDYKGIELKSTRRRSASTRSTLFAQVADWSSSKLKSSREILDKYGYERGLDFKLYCTVSALRLNSQGLQFTLENDGQELHEVHNEDGKVVIWKAELLKDRLQEKHAETFWIKAEAKKINGEEFFYLESVIHTRSPLKSQLLPLIEEGVITMDHLIKRNEKGHVSEKGPLFKISPKNLDLLFPSPIEYDLLE